MNTAPAPRPAPITSGNGFGAAINTGQPRNPNVGIGQHGNPIMSAPVGRPNPGNMPGVNQIQSAPLGRGGGSQPTITGDSKTGVTVQDGSQTIDFKPTDLSKTIIQARLQQTFPTKSTKDIDTLVQRINQQASITENLICGDNSSTVTYNPHDPDDKALASKEKAQCEKANKQKDHEQDANLKRIAAARRKTKLMTVPPSLSGAVNYFAAVFTIGYGDGMKTWFFLIAYMVLLVGFVLAMWGIMTKGTKKYTTYKSVFFGLYVGSFIGIILDLIFNQPRENGGIPVSNYGGLFLIIVFTVMSLIMGWQGIYRMLKEKDDN